MVSLQSPEPRVAKNAPGRRERQKQARQRRILAVASALFQARGFARTSIEDIAARAELAVGTIYNYFGSKPEILLAIVHGETSQALAAGASILKRLPADPARAIAALLTVYTGLVTHHDRELWRELLGAIVARPRTLGRDLFGEDLRLIAQLQSLLRDFAQQGRLDAALDPARAAMTLYGVFMNWCLLYSTNEDLTASQLEAEIQSSVEIVVNGLRPREKGEST